MNFHQSFLIHSSINRLEGKAANLEAENQVLRQQSTATPPSTVKSSASRSKITRIHVKYFFKEPALNMLCSIIQNSKLDLLLFLQKSPDNGHILNGDIKQTEMKPSTGTSEAIPSVVRLTMFIAA
jgi:myosin V